MNFRFEALGPHAEAARRAIAPALEAGALPPLAVLVKASLSRTVHRLPLDGAGTVYLKIDRPRDLAERAKYLFLASRARAEWENLLRLGAEGIAVPEPIAWAERRRRGALAEAALLTRAVDGARGFFDRLTPATVAAAGAIARRLHDRGYFHRDYHPGNLLVREDGSVVLVDLQKLWRLPAVPLRLRARDLGVFLHDLARSGEEALSGAFLDGYGADRRLRERVARAQAARRRERVASRARRCVVRSSGFRIEREGGLRIYRRADVPREGILEAIEGHRRTLAAGPGAPGFVKLDYPTTSITRQPPLAAEGPGAGPVAVKEFPARGFLAGLESLARTHRGRQAWLAAHALLTRGVETPLPLALVEVRRFGLVVGSYFLTRWLEPAEDAHLYIDRRFAGGRETAPPGRASGPWGGGGERAPLGRRAEAEAVRAFARFVARIHAEGIYHCDLKLPNFLVIDGDPPRFALLDLDAVRLGRRLTRRRRAKNLGQIEDYARFYLPQVKRTHRVRFLREYGAGAEPSLVALVEKHVRYRWTRRERIMARRAARGEGYPAG